MNSELPTKFRVLDLLCKSSSSNISQQERVNVEEELKMLGLASFSGHMSDLCQILESPEIPNANPQKDYAAIYLKNYVRNTVGGAKEDKSKTKL